MRHGTSEQNRRSFAEESRRFAVGVGGFIWRRRDGGNYGRRIYWCVVVDEGGGESMLSGEEYEWRKRGGDLKNRAAL